MNRPQFRLVEDNIQRTKHVVTACGVEGAPEVDTC